jgi:hypothetical protein
MNAEREIATRADEVFLTPYLTRKIDKKEGCVKGWVEDVQSLRLRHKGGLGYIFLYKQRMHKTHFVLSLYDQPFLFHSDREGRSSGCYECIVTKVQKGSRLAAVGYSIFEEKERFNVRENKTFCRIAHTITAYKQA